MQFTSWLIFALVVTFGVIIDGFAENSSNIPNAQGLSEVNAMLDTKTLKLDQATFEGEPLNTDMGFFSIIKDIDKVKKSFMLDYEWFKQEPLNILRFIWLAYYGAFSLYTFFYLGSAILGRVT